MCVTFSGKKFFPQKLGKWTKNRPKAGFFFNLLKNLVINFYWIRSIMKVYIICSVPAEIPYLGKFFSWDRAKMFSVNHIAGFLKLFLQNKLIKNLLVGRGQKWVWQIWSWNSKIDVILRMNRRKKLLFAVLIHKN